MQKRAIPKIRRSRDERLDGDLQLILDEIEKEVVPERLLQLAFRLQEALADRHKSIADD